LQDREEKVEQVSEADTVGMVVGQDPPLHPVPAAMEVTAVLVVMGAVVVNTATH